MLFELFVFTLGVLSGVLLVGAIAIVLVRRYWHALPFAEPDIKPLPYMPPRLGDELKNFDATHPKPQKHQNENFPVENMTALNMFVHTLFVHKRDSIGVRRLLLRIIERNLYSLRTKTQLRMLIKHMTLLDMNLGEAMPTVKNVILRRPKHTSSFQNTDETEIEFDLNYDGGFHIKLGCDLVLGRRAQVSITADSLEGRGLIAIRANPHPHWTFCFLNEPKLELSVSSILQNKAVAQLDGIIASQIQRAVKKQHMCPSQRKRYAPFFPEPTRNPLAKPELFQAPAHQGRWDVWLLKAVDFAEVNPSFQLYLVLSLQDRDKDGVWEGKGDEQTLSITLPRAGAMGSVGVKFDSNVEKNGIRVIEVLDNARKKGVRVNDIVTKVNGVPVLSLKRAHQLVQKSDNFVHLTIVRHVDDKDIEEDDEKSLSLATGFATPVKNSAVFGTPTDAPLRFDTSAEEQLLHVRLYSCRVNREKRRVGRRYLCGYGQVNMQQVAAFCIVNQMPFRYRCPLRLTADPASPSSGNVEMILKHFPTLSETSTDVAVAPPEDVKPSKSDDSQAQAQSETEAASAASTASSRQAVNQRVQRAMNAINSLHDESQSSLSQRSSRDLDVRSVDNGRTSKRVASPTQSLQAFPLSSKEESGVTDYGTSRRRAQSEAATGAAVQDREAPKEQASVSQASANGAASASNDTSKPFAQTSAQRRMLQDDYESDDDDLDFFHDLEPADDLEEDKRAAVLFGDIQEVEDVGDELFADLEPSERKVELEQLLDTLNAMIELETETRSSLVKQLKKAKSSADKKRLKENIHASDERYKDVALRLLKCTSALSRLEGSGSSPSKW